MAQASKSLGMPQHMADAAHDDCFIALIQIMCAIISASSQIRRNFIAMTTLDRTDLRILAVLQGEGRITNADLAERVSLSPSACLRRLQRLEAEGILTGYTAQVDPQAIGLGLQAFVRVQLTKHESAAVEHFVGLVNGWDEVVACYALTGDMDYLLHVYVTDLQDFSRFLLDRLLNAAGVADVNSSFVLRTVKRSAALPLAQLER
jgi:Lrp/AsnC family leucine-responsive transcriptional regulator